MQKGKVVFIGGNKRAGKTTLSVKLHKEAGFNYYDLDMITNALEDGLQEVDASKEGDTKYYAKFFECMVKSALDEAENRGINSVFNYIFFEPEFMSTFKYRDDIEIYYLANLDANPENIIEDMMKYSKQYDWPAYATEEDIKRNVTFILNRNISLKEECDEYGFRLINTSRGENRNIVLDKVFDEITKDILKDVKEVSGRKTM